MIATPEMRTFNALVQIFDASTLFRFDRVDPSAILDFIRANHGEMSSWANNFERAARAVGYFAEEPCLLSK